jgi:hypothetical protein
MAAKRRRRRAGNEDGAVGAGRQPSVQGVWFAHQHDAKAEGEWEDPRAKAGQRTDCGASCSRKKMRPRRRACRSAPTRNILFPPRMSILLVMGCESIPPRWWRCACNEATVTGVRTSHAQRVSAALAQGVSSMPQVVLEWLLAGRESHPAGGLCSERALFHCGGKGRGAL